MPTTVDGVNGLFIGYLIIASLLSIFFLLYFNRLFASIVSWALRTWTWHQYRVYIDIQALQISLLAGRVFFTGLRYHGNNETILVQNGHITWSYWLRRVRSVSLGKGNGSGAKEDRSKGKTTEKPQVDEAARNSDSSGGSDSRVPCRLNVSLVGLEWFVYNRSAAYDFVLKGMMEETDEAEPHVPEFEPVYEDSSGKVRHRGAKSGRGPSEGLGPDSTANPKTGLWAAPHAPPPSGLVAAPPRVHSDRSTRSDGGDDSSEPGDGCSGEEDLPLLLQLFPIHVECEKGALVMGNENTKAILIVKTEGLTGEIDASATETPDPYRQLFKLKFKHPVVEMRENEDFREDQADKALREKSLAQETGPVLKPSFFRQQRRRLYGQLRNLVPYWRKSVESFSVDSRSRVGTATEPQVPGSAHWQGLSRYIEDRDGDERTRWSASEYAAINTVVDSPEALLTIYWDAVGKVSGSSAIPVQEKHETEEAKSLSRNINGRDPPPAWGINVSVKGGSVNYGPWADRQRADLQRIFFPSLCKDATVTRPLSPGADRMPTQFKLYVELDEAVTLRIPTREESKNWRFKGQEMKTAPRVPGDRRKARASKKAEPTPGHQRPYGWLDVKIAANATVSYSMDMVASETGFSSVLRLDLPKTEISTSVNHELLWRSGPQQISCDLSTPLKWNSLRQWRFGVDSQDLELFLLRDHVFLLIDLVDDWSTGPPADYMTFTPFKYHLDLHLRHIRLYLNVNDANIINNPTDFDDNTFLTISSPLLDAGVCIPIDKYLPPKNAIPFDVKADSLAMALHVPPWNTQSSFLSSKEIGQLENLDVDGAYHYNATTSPANTDTLVLNVSGQSPSATLYGFIVRYFLKLKDNYFGDDIHFKTLEEYQEMLRLKQENPEAELASRPPPKKANDLDVILSVRTDDPKMLLPANLYSSGSHVQIDTACLSADLRFTNYYMDIDLAVAPLSLSPGSDDGGMDTPMGATTSTQLFVDGVSIYGHRLFGLPPIEPTYLCNWDVSAGAVTGECTADFLTALMNGAKAFAFSFDDDENALTPAAALAVYDVTFLRVFLDSVRLWLHIEEAAFLLSTGSVDVTFNDWARSHYSRRANVEIPHIELSCVNSETAVRHKSRSQRPLETEATVATSLRLALVGRKYEFSRERQLQQELVRREDQRTHRTDFLLLSGALDEVEPDAVEPVAQPVPNIPQPTSHGDLPEPSIRADGMSVTSGATSRRSRGLRHKSSFLSLASSSQSSVLRPQSSHRSSVRSRRIGQLRPLTRADQQQQQKQQQKQQQELMGRSSRPSMHKRELSASTRHSAFYSAVGDLGDRRETSHNTVAFSSQYFAPYFPLEGVAVGSGGAASPSLEEEEHKGDRQAQTEFDLGDIDPEMLDEDCSHMSLLVETPAGLTAFFNPTSIRYIATLLSALQPVEPDDILDSLQTGAMSSIFDLLKDQTTKGSVTDIVLRIPRASVRFLNSSSLDSPDASHDEQDQYDASLTSLALASRTERRWEDAFDAASKQTRKSFHLRLGSVEVSASERIADVEELQCAVMGRIEHVMVSMGSRDVSFLDADVGSIQGNTSSEKIEYLASLIHRTNVLAADLGSLLSTMMGSQGRASQHLVHALVTRGHAAPDPSFVVRPSATLRSATRHLRTFDSWKLAMRLRQLWATLDAGAREELRMECVGGTADAPPDARDQVVASFQKWRSWDLDNVSDAYLLHHVFEPPANAAASPPEQDVPHIAALRIHQARLALDPGPRQNEISFVDLTARLQSKAPPLRGLQLHPDEDEDAPGAEREPLTIINLCCGDAVVSLNWDLCELAEDVLRLYEKVQLNMEATGRRAQGSAQPPVPPSPRPPTTDAKRSQTLHVVLELGQGALVVDTVNLNGKSTSSDVKASLLVRRDGSGASDTNFILSCDRVASKIRSHAQLLTVLQLVQPSVFLSHDLHKSATTNQHVIKATASSHGLSLAIKQDPVILMEVLDLLIRDEATQLYRLKRLLPTASSKPKPTLPPPSSPTKNGKRMITDQLSAFRVNIALFLDEYSISLPLLRSLTYNISGVVARAAMAANFGREVIFDFDVKENSHEMQVLVKNKPRSISLLQIPPTNGRITTLLHGDNKTTVFASVELIQLDASAVYSLLSALNRPEVSSTINDLQAQLQIIKSHVKETFDAQEDPVVVSVPHQPPTTKAETTATARPASVKGAPLEYSIHLTFAGLEVFGDMPLKSELDPLAHLLFYLDSIHLEVDNRPDPRGPVLENPEVRANLRQIAFEIQKGSPGAMTSCGSVAFGALVTATTRVADGGAEERSFNVTSKGFDVFLSPETVSTFVDVVGYMGDKIKDLDTSRELEYLRKLRQNRPRIAINDQEEDKESDIIESFFSSIAYSFEVRDIQVCWLVLGLREEPSPGKDDLVVTLQRIEFATRTRNSARLTIENLQVQMVSPTQDRKARSPNSALLPEVVFNVAYVSTVDARRLAFQAVGKSVDFRVTSDFIIPASNLTDSISLSIKNIQQASENWLPTTTAAATPSPLSPASPGMPETAATQEKPARSRSLLGSKRLESLLVDADFAGAVVYVSGRKAAAASDSWMGLQTTTKGRPSVSGRHAQFGLDESAAAAAGSSTVLRSPGLAVKVEYRDNGKDDPTLYAETKLDASSNTLYPSVVPLIMDITNSIKEVVSSGDDEAVAGSGAPSSGAGAEAAQAREPQDSQAPRLKQEDSILRAVDPTAVLGRLKLNLGLRIYRQEFSLSCQPIARVAATASFEDIYFTLNTVRSVEQGNFVAISGAFSNINASVQHVYSRESTGSFEVDSIVLSLMNSKHVSGVSGVSAILKVSPMKVAINAKQLQDFLLFREIWLPRDSDFGSTSASTAAASSSSSAGAGAGSGAAGLGKGLSTSSTAAPKLAAETSQSHLVQRYQQVAATTAFPWTATISISALDINVDLGQAIGKSVFSITDFWISSKKTSDWEQNLCLGFSRIGVDSTGRMSGFVAMQNFRLRTLIRWPEREAALNETPLVQASIGFSQFRVKAAFDYQAFLVADITSMEFLMYNVRRSQDGGSDRLVAIFDGDAVQVFGTTTSAAQGVALYQAFRKLVQERRTNFESSVREIEKFTRRRSSTVPDVVKRLTNPKGKKAGDDGDDDDPLSKSPISLDTDVVVTLRALNLGVFPSTFADHQVFKMEALDAQARFTASVTDANDRRIHSMLGLTLGQLRIGLAAVRQGGSGSAGLSKSSQQQQQPSQTQTQKTESASATGSSAPSGVAAALAAAGASLGSAPMTTPESSKPGTKATASNATAGTTSTTATTTTTTAAVRHGATAGELSVEDVVLSATGSRGGTILKVPKVEAVMQTWQAPRSRHIDYIFKSAFEGKVEVGWNYSRISYIRGMWANHSKTLALTWGKELALPAIKVTGVPGPSSSSDGDGKDKTQKASGDKQKDGGGDGQTISSNKITAEVHVPQSKYQYNPLEAPVIETPQLRDMGEATPPLEWIGLHRDRLPNLTHQIVIVSLLELAGEVEDAYKRILGTT